MDAVKRGYDDIVEGFRDPTSGKLVLDQYGNAVNQVRATYTRSLRAMYPKYGEALDAWAGPSQTMEAVQFGKDALKIEPAAIKDRLADMPKSDLEFARLGLASTLRKLVGDAGMHTNEAQLLIKSGNRIEQIRQFFPDDAAFQKFMASVKAESLMARTKGEIIGNSRTAARMAEDNSPESEAFGHMAKAGVNLAKGNQLASVFNGVKAMLSPRRAPNAELNAEIARLLATPGGGRSVNALRDRQANPPVKYLATALRPAIPAAAAGTAQAGNGP